MANVWGSLQVESGFYLSLGIPYGRRLDIFEG